MVMEVIKEIAHIPGVLKEVYGDLAKPGVEQVGKALGTVIGLGNTILWPVALTNAKARIALESNLEKYRKRLEGTLKEEITEVAPEIGVPIGEKIAYVTNEELSDMYIELLAKASTGSSASLAHPSFVNVINNLSPDEAVLLKTLRTDQTLPFVQIRVQISGQNQFQVLDPLYSPLSKVTGISFPDNLAAYLSNLQGLGILQVRTDIYLADKELYESLEFESKARFKVKEMEDGTEPKMSITFKKGKIDVTPFGGLFLQACFAK
jgi:hypothetical protein